MKKITTLLFAGCAFVGAQAQNMAKPTQTVGKATVKYKQDAMGAGVQSTKKVRKTTDAFFPTLIGTKENTGTTTYDLQSNGSMPRRVLLDGTKISCGWTLSTEQNVNATSPYADRGTGYSHYNGTTWTAAPTARLEPVRTGFGSLAKDGNGNEVYVSHDASYNLQLARKTGTSWTTTQLTTNNSLGAIWPHIATSGNWMYIVAAAQDSNIHSNGIRNGYFFSRSSDNGATWIDNMIPLPLVDSVSHYRGGGNSYAVSASGNNIAVLCGDVGSDLTLVTSADNGATWSKKEIWDFGMNNYDFASTIPTDTNNDAIVDTLWTNDGSHTMVLDDNGVAHIAFPIIRVYKDGSSTGYSFFYETSLLYYNSVADSLQLIDNIFRLYNDCDGDSTFSLGVNYTSADPGDAIYNTIGLISQPSITVTTGATPSVLIAYTRVMDADTTVEDPDHLFWFGTGSMTGQNYRDVMVIGTNDNGANWTFPVNVTRTAHFEETFVSTPERITGNVFPLLYQGDIEPGTIMQNDDYFDATFQNMQILQQVTLTDIFTTFGNDQTAPCGQVELPLGVKNILSDNDGIVNVYPNPTTDAVNVAVKFINTTSNLEVKVTDIAGNVVYSTMLNGVNETVVNIPTKSFANGMYIVNLISDKGVITRKFSKQ